MIRLRELKDQCRQLPMAKCSETEMEIPAWAFLGERAEEREMVRRHGGCRWRRQEDVWFILSPFVLKIL